MQVNVRVNLCHSKTSLFIALWAMLWVGVLLLCGGTAVADGKALTDQEISSLISTFNKSKTPQNAQVIFDSFGKTIAAKKKEGDYTGAIQLTGRAMNVAKQVKSLEYYTFHDLKEALIKEKKLNRQKETLKKALEKNAGNKMSREKLIQIYLINEDDPKKAAALVTEDINEELQAVAAAAKKPSRDLTEKELLMLGEWYFAKGKDDLCALKRARTYYEQFLELHQKKDAAYLKANETLGDVKLEIGKMNPKRFIVPSNVIWKSVLSVQKGQTVLITAQGTWYAGSRKNRLKATPDGGLHPSSRNDFYLEGRIGNINAMDFYQSPIFKIGSNLKLVIPNDGTLYMQMHDYSHNGNCGEIVVSVIQAD